MLCVPKRTSVNVNFERLVLANSLIVELNFKWH